MQSVLTELFGNDPGILITLILTVLDLVIDYLSITNSLPASIIWLNTVKEYYSQSITTFYCKILNSKLFDIITI